jgi:hypothetical protein
MTEVTLVPLAPDAGHEMDEQFPDGMFRFEKRMNGCHKEDIEY